MNTAPLRPRLPWLSFIIPRSSFLVSCLCFLVPLVYLGVLFWLMPADRLVDRRKPDGVDPWVARLLFDDYDAAARALRGLNASLGRTPGLPDDPPWLHDEDFRGRMALGPVRPEYLASLAVAPQASFPGNLPWAALFQCTQPDPPYFLEYPHTALVLFRMGYLFGNEVDPAHVPPAVRDGRFHNLAQYAPRTDDERQLWRHLRRAIQFYAVLGAVCLLALMVVVRVGYEPGGNLSGPIVLLVLPATLYFSVQRFDVVPALLMALSLFCLGRRWVVASAFFLGAATMVKVYPVLLTPLVLRFLFDRHRPRPALAWALVYGGTIGAFLLPSLLLSGWEATWAPYRWQTSRWPEFGWTFYEWLLPPRLAGNDPLGRWFRQGTVILTVLALMWRRPAGLDGVLRRGAVVLIVFVSLQVFYSAQWIVWYTPLLVPLARRQRAVFWLTLALDLATYNTFPVVFDLNASLEADFLRVELIYVRAAICAALVWVLLRAEFGKTERETEAPRSDVLEGSSTS